MQQILIPFSHPYRVMGNVWIALPGPKKQHKQAHRIAGYCLWKHLFAEVGLARQHLPVNSWWVSVTNHIISRNEGPVGRAHTCNILVRNTNLSDICIQFQINTLADHKRF